MDRSKSGERRGEDSRQSKPHCDHSDLESRGLEELARNSIWQEHNTYAKMGGDSGKMRKAIQLLLLLRKITLLAVWRMDSERKRLAAQLGREENVLKTITRMRKESRAVREMEGSRDGRKDL